MITKDGYKSLLNFLIWCILGVIISLIGISNVFADTYDATQYNAQLYDNYGPNLSAVSTTFSNMSWRGTIPSMVANSSGAAWGISSPIVLIANHTYSISIRIEGTYGGLLVLSTYNRIGVGTTLGNAVSSYQNNSYVNEIYSNIVSGQPIIQFAFTPTINANYIVFPFATNYSGSNQSFYLYNVIIDDLGSSGVSESTINNSLNNQTNVLNNSITSSESNIRGAITDTEDNIRNAITDTEDSINNTINDNFNTCTNTGNYFNKDTVLIGYTTNSSGVVISSSNSFVSDFIKVEPNTVYHVSSEIPVVVGYNSSKNFVSTLRNTNSAGTFNTGSSIAYVRVRSYWVSDMNNINSILSTAIMNKGSSQIAYVPFGEQCTNKLDEQTNAINGLNDTLNDDDTDEATSEASDFFSDFTTNTFGLTSIITAPLTLIQSLTSKTCSPLHLPLPYLNNKYLDLPCMSTIYSQHFGTFFTLYQTITYGIIAYWVCVRIFNHVKDFKNPEHDEIEVVDL